MSEQDKTPEHEPKQVCKCSRPVRMFGRVCAACGDALPEDDASPARQPEPLIHTVFGAGMQPEPLDMRGTVVLPHEPNAIFSASIPLQEPPDLEATCECLPGLIGKSLLCPIHGGKKLDCYKVVSDLEAMARELIDTIMPEWTSDHNKEAHLIPPVRKVLQQVDAAARETSDSIAALLETEQTLTVKLIQERDQARAEVIKLKQMLEDLSE